MTFQITVRKFKIEDAQALANIFFNTIHLINSQHYTKEQVDVWAPESSLNAERWKIKFMRTNPYVAVVDHQVVGFAEFEPDGHIDCFYSHHDWIGKGVGSALMQSIFEEAHQKRINRIYAEVSITAKPFFERHGFTVICEQTIVKNEVKMINYKMEKLINSV